jgi:hypothetical protein
MSKGNKNDVLVFLKVMSIPLEKGICLLFFREGNF